MTVRRKRVAVTAYAANNLGDDLFIRSVLQRYPDTEFVFFASIDGLRMADGLPNMGGTITFREFVQQRKTFSMYLILGGSMFQQRPGWMPLWVNYARRILTARFFGIPTFVTGASFGPYAHRRFRLAFGALFRLSRHITFRDTASARVFSGLRQVDVYPDLAFAVPVPEPLEPNEKPIGMSVMEFGSGVEAAGYTEQCATIITESHPSSRFLLFAFQESGDLSDSRAATQVLQLLTPERAACVDVITYDGRNLDHVLASIGSCASFYATRFHSMIIAVLYDLPVTVMLYHPKILAALTDTLEQAPETSQRPQPSAPGLSFVQVRLPRKRTAELTVQAEGHFRAIDPVLKQ